jgi:hypothetical protein
MVRTDSQERPPLIVLRVEIAPSLRYAITAIFFFAATNEDLQGRSVSPVAIVFSVGLLAAPVDSIGAQYNPATMTVMTKAKRERAVAIMLCRPSSLRRQDH